jgi:hypothetical protein
VDLLRPWREQVDGPAWLPTKPGDQSIKSETPAPPVAAPRDLPVPTGRLIPRAGIFLR